MRDAVLLLFLAAPVLMFTGYYLAKILFRDREYAQPADVVVMPHDLTWLNYTTNSRIVAEISHAVVQVRQSPPIRYSQIAPYLETAEAHRVAMEIDSFHVYREHAIRQYLEAIYSQRQLQEERKMLSGA